ncbi:MAG: MBOAT family protein [Planctomycetota bacterium]
MAVFKGCELLLNQRPAPGVIAVWTWLAWVRPYNHVYARRGVGAPYPPGTCARKLALGVPLVALGVPLVIVSFQADLGRYGFWVDHLAKFCAFYLALSGLERLLTAGWNLAGIPARPLLDDPILAYSPAAFWQRWNHPVNQLFAAILFRRWARRAPVAALLLCFVASGVLHEYIAAIASWHLRGYQLAFFLLHGLAAAATWRWRPRGPAARAAGRVGTVAFGLLTSPLFFASLVPVFADLGPLYPHGALLPP